MAWTEKGSRFRSLQFEIRQITHADGCMVCGCARRDAISVAKVAEVLEKYGINPKDVEKEMQTITDDFVFASGWKRVDDGSCYMDIHDFLAVCYKSF